MPSRDKRSEPHKEAPTPTDRSFDSFAKELATGNVSRGHMLKWAGRALLGATLFSIPGVSWAAPQGSRPSGVGGCPEGLVKGRKGQCVCPDGSKPCGAVCCPSGQVCGT